MALTTARVGKRTAASRDCRRCSQSSTGNSASSATAQGSCSRMGDLRGGGNGLWLGVFDEASRRAVCGFAVGRSRQMARELHQIGLHEEIAEQATLRRAQAAVAGGGRQKLLRGHLGRADAE